MRKEMAVAVIEVRFERRPDDSIYISSPNVPGFHLWGHDLGDLCDDVIPALKGLFKLNKGLDVDLVPVSDIADFPSVAPEICVEGRDTSQLVMSLMA